MEKGVVYRQFHTPLYKLPGGVLRSRGACRLTRGSSAGGLGAVRRIVCAIIVFFLRARLGYCVFAKRMV